MISHDMDYVAENSERIIVMAEAEIIKEGSPKEVFADEAVLEKAQIEPPQIMQLDFNLDSRTLNSTLSVEEFINKYKSHIKIRKEKEYDKF